MALILRVDVDKPYGKHTIIRKLLSKVVEDYLPNLNIKTGYLSHLKEMVNCCNQMGVCGHFFHRICTFPDQETLSLYKVGNHSYGLHFENSRNEENLVNEIKQLEERTGVTNIKSFSKHGSGEFKLGKYHYPAYEPEKYKKWAANLGLSYHSGNGIAKSPSDLDKINGFNEYLFWMEPTYRNNAFKNIVSLVDYAEKKDAVVIIHPCNFIADLDTFNEFKKLVNLSKERGILWRKIEA